MTDDEKRNHTKKTTCYLQGEKLIELKEILLKSCTIAVNAVLNT